MPKIQRSSLIRDILYTKNSAGVPYYLCGEKLITLRRCLECKKWTKQNLIYDNNTKALIAQSSCCGAKIKKERYDSN